MLNLQNFDSLDLCKSLQFLKNIMFLIFHDFYQL